MNTDTQRPIAEYGAWPSPIDAERLFKQPGAPAHPCAHRGLLYWLESRAAEGGRTALMRSRAGEPATLVTPQGYSIRSRVHEYGGKAHCFHDDVVLFVNYDDQRVYRQELHQDLPVAPITVPSLADGRRVRYADLTMHPDGRQLIAVIEIENAETEHDNAIAVLDLGGVERGELITPRVLVQGASFYAAPVISGDGQFMAFVQWQHPHMPWDSSTLQRAVIAKDGDAIVIGEVDHVAGGDGRAVCQPAFASDGSLWFAMDIDNFSDRDAQNYWNLYRAAQSVEPVTQDKYEYGAAHWVFGSRRFVHLDAANVLAVRTSAGGDELVIIDGASGRIKTIATACSEFAQLSVVADEQDRRALTSRAFLVAAGATQGPTIARLDLHGNEVRMHGEPPPLIDKVDVSEPRALCVPCKGGDVTHAYYYAPRNARVKPPRSSLPPVMVLVHGGPTSRAQTGLDLAKQFWTTRGFGVLDVNHRGSTGYGRRYRQCLRGQWGIIDADDVLACVDHLIDEGLVDAQRIAIRGGSAGGYVVLNVLTRFPDRFQVGACYYGIGNLVTLAQTTHKFERFYVDALIGEEFDPIRAADPASAYYQRSPVHRIDRIRSATLLLQGGKDRVVPKEVSRECVAALAAHGVDHDYVEYPDEGHGFRDPAVRIDALERELAFVRRALAIGDA